MKNYQESKTLNELIENALEKLKGIVDSSVIIGEKVVCDDGSIIIPVSKVTVGYVVGGGEYADLSARRVANHFPMAGGSSGGMSVSPVGFLIEKGGSYNFVNVENKTMYQTVLNLVNSIISKLQKEGENEKK